MKRKNFIAASLAFAAAPLSAVAYHPKERGKGFKVKAGEGRLHGHMKLKGVNSNILDLKVSGSDTGGSLAVFEQTSISQGRGTPLHIHPLQDEMFYVIEGEYYFKVGEETFTLTTGDSIFLPKNIPHAWTQISPLGKMTVIFQPAGKMEDFFLAAAALDHEPTKTEMVKLFADNEMKLVGPPLIIN